MKVTKSTQISVKDVLDGVEFDISYNVEYNEFNIKIGDKSLFLTGLEMDKFTELLNKILATK